MEQAQLSKHSEREQEREKGKKEEGKRERPFECKNI